mmetsp:Transcript_8548/g.24532  ORF Transcript_8548/g.24532 Transcript_8548/m.24532 type:complete len:215 (+) Transcript_8548:1360-2004(+)
MGSCLSQKAQKPPVCRAYPAGQILSAGFSSTHSPSRNTRGSSQYWIGARSVTTSDAQVVPSGWIVSPSRQPGTAIAEDSFTHSPSSRSKSGSAQEYSTGCVSSRFRTTHLPSTAVAKGETHSTTGLSWTAWTQLTNSLVPLVSTVVVTGEYGSSHLRKASTNSVRTQARTSRPPPPPSGAVMVYSATFQPASSFSHQGSVRLSYLGLTQATRPS